MPNNPAPVFCAKNVTKTFRHGKTLVKAVDDVSFSIADGEIVSIVGGSGCGKSVLAKAMLGLYKQNQGEFTYRGKAITDTRSHWNEVQSVFQDPFSCFNQFFSIRSQLKDSLNSRIGYVDSLREKIGNNKKLPLTYLDRFHGENCAVLERDARAGLWAGCENGIVHITPAKDPVLTKQQYFNRNDGLLSNRIIDLSVDPLTGEVWAVTENGISVFQSEAQPPPGGVSGVKAYPNPFRGRHQMLVIDNVPPGASGAILTQSGDAVRRFESRDLRGNQFQWDGNNAVGHKVTPGVYFYSISADGKTSRGKIIVAR